jgi:transposase
MRVSIVKSSNAESFYIIESVWEGGKRTTRVVEKLGTRKELEKKLDGQDVLVWAKAYAKELTAKRKAGIHESVVRFSNSRFLPLNEPQRLHGGYLFLQSLYHQLRLDDLCNQIRERYKFEYDLDSILSRLLYTRILSPSSKRASCEISRHYLEPPHFEPHHVYRALDVLAEENDWIQAELYKNSLRLADRNTKILYYDCTNYFFEINMASDDKQYGPSKQHQPRPLVQMGLFLDGSGLPLAFTLTPGNQNEQRTLRPLEERILHDFSLSKFIVCTDAGLASKANRRFNNIGDRAYVTTQSIKKLKQDLQAWALSPSGWQLSGDSTDKRYNLDKLKEKENDQRLFYKMQAITDGKLEEFLLVTFSPKYQSYQRTIREQQIQRAIKKLDNKASLKKKRPNDPARFIAAIHHTDDREVADHTMYLLDEAVIADEERFDGFYAVCTNLEGNPEDIIRINRGRWEIEQAFRTLKTEFRARPVHLSNKKRILAHFTTCFIALLIYRLLESRVNLQQQEKITGPALLSTLKDMDFLKLKNGDYVPAYTRTTITDALHDTFGFRTDTELVSKKCLRNVIMKTKRQ